MHMHETINCICRFGLTRWHALACQHVSSRLHLIGAFKSHFAPRSKADWYKENTSCAKEHQ